ncbi:hypothetical protein OF83DRAFT_774310 [Amylostereum chailletii]|nr:hypothetical protein OF83DRAFT_774310 [Amylostereum chailletii]
MSRARCVCSRLGLQASRRPPRTSTGIGSPTNSLSFVEPAVVSGVPFVPFCRGCRSMTWTLGNVEAYSLDALDGVYR